MLQLDGAPFTTGRAKFLDGLPANPNQSARIYVKVTVEGMEEPVLALLDTGAEFSVIAPEVAEATGLQDADGEQITLRHKDGTTPGKLVRTTMAMLADEGETLDVSATVFVPSDGWPQGLTFLGYSGFLELVKVVLDPQNNELYFGGY